MFVNTRIGVLGGGQLGKMLAQAASRWNLNLWLMDKEFDYPAARVTNQFIQGDFTDFQMVYQLGKLMDIITIEIENVNTDALEKLEIEGKEVYPQSRVIKIIKDKGLQKKFYRDRDLPTSEFLFVDDAAHIREMISTGEIKFPFVQKTRTEGYDGRGVQVINNETDLSLLMDKPSILEKKEDIGMEIAVLVARNIHGDLAVYPPVEMAFHPTANLVEQLISPARISEFQKREAQLLAKKIITEWQMIGLLAVEFFITKKGDLLINEAAPRPHNSGHHTIEGNITSQYEQHLRAILGLPLGDPGTVSPAVMFNLLGEPGFQGEAYYQGLEEVLKIPQVYVHLYGKKETKPFRKMGHVTILDQDISRAVSKAKEVSSILKVIS